MILMSIMIVLVAGVFMYSYFHLAKDLDATQEYLNDIKENMHKLVKKNEALMLENKVLKESVKPKRRETKDE